MSRQVWSAESYARNAAFVPAFGAGVVEWLAPVAGERILDLGCGEGTLTETIVAAGATVVGVDASESMIAGARARGLDARVADARSLPFEREFDAVFSNAALHWMPEPDRVIANVARALVPGGRFVAEMGGEGNAATILAAMRASLERRGIDPQPRMPWYFPSLEDYAARLNAGGFSLERCELFARPTPLPSGMDTWLETFAQPFFADLDDATQRDIVAEVSSDLAPKLRDADGRWVADYVRLRFRARLN